MFQVTLRVVRSGCDIRFPAVLRIIVLASFLHIHVYIPMSLFLMFFAILFLFLGGFKRIIESPVYGYECSLCCFACLFCRTRHPHFL